MCSVLGDLQVIFHLVLRVKIKVDIILLPIKWHGNNAYVSRISLGYKKIMSVWYLA